jgi:hypothetical protein
MRRLRDEKQMLQYQFAQGNSMSETNLLKAHSILSKTQLIKSKRGKYRIEPVGVFGKEGLVYLAVEPESTCTYLICFKTMN